jgi:hypothetical protein
MVPPSFGYGRSDRHTPPESSVGAHHQRAYSLTNGNSRSAVRSARTCRKLPPVTVFRLEDQTLLLVDGYHRMAAARAAGRITVRADVQEGTKTEAIQFAAERAARERGFSNQQAREAIKRYSGGQWSKQDR